MAAVDIRVLIRQMQAANPLWGAPRIHGEFQKLGLEVSQTTVPPSPTRRTFPPITTSNSPRVTALRFPPQPYARSCCRPDRWAHLGVKTVRGAWMTRKSVKPPQALYRRAIVVWSNQ